MKFDKALEVWENYQRNILGRSENTILNYKLDVSNFFKFLEKENVSDVSKEEAEKYFESLAKKGIAETTRARKISALQMFYGFLNEKEYTESNPVKSLAKPKLPQKKVLAMDLSEINKVINAAKERDGRRKDYFRNLAIVSLFFATGLRRNEIVNIKVQDVNITESSILVRMGKGNKQRMVYFNNTTKAILSEYLASHRDIYETAKTSDYLFVSQKAEKMCVSAVNNLFNNILEDAGLKEKGYTVHSSRRSFATTVYGATKDIVTVQKLLGHTNPQTTMRYVGCSEEIKKQAAQLVNF